MGLWDAFRRLTKPYTDDEYLDEDLEEASASRSLFPRRETRSYTDYAETPSAPESGEKRSIFSAIRSVASSGGEEASESRGGTAVAQRSMQLKVMNPKRFQDAAVVADSMRQGGAIVLNLEDMEKSETRRLIDFVSGAAYLQKGRIQRIAGDTYLVSPPGMDISGDDLSSLGSRDYSPNYFA